MSTLHQLLTVQDRGVAPYTNLRDTSRCRWVNMSVTELANRLGDLERMVSHTIMNDIVNVHARVHSVEPTVDSLPDVVNPLLRMQTTTASSTTDLDAKDNATGPAAAEAMSSTTLVEDPLSMAPMQPASPPNEATSPRAQGQALSPGNKKPSLMHLDNMFHDLQHTIITNNAGMNSNIASMDNDMAQLHDLCDQALRALVPYTGLTAKDGVLSCSPLWLMNDPTLPSEKHCLLDPKI